MKKRTSLGLLALAFGCTCMAQRGPFLNFTAGLKESNKVVWLQWDADSAAEGDYFVVERGQDETHFETIGALRSTGIRGHYELTDQAPPNGTDFYRIKYIRQDRSTGSKSTGRRSTGGPSTAIDSSAHDSTGRNTTANDTTRGSLTTSDSKDRGPNDSTRRRPTSGDFPGSDSTGRGPNNSTRRSPTSGNFPGSDSKDRGPNDSTRRSPTSGNFPGSDSTGRGPTSSDISSSDSAVYSKTLQLSLSSDVDFKFYPNPVDKVFIVRTEHSLDLQILDPSGNTRLSKRLQPGIQVINVASLETGVYILRVTDKESNRAVSQQLVKN